MAKDILTLALEGEVALNEFAIALNSFNQLLIQLAVEVGRNAKIEWVVDELHAGSAIATFKGIYQEEMVVENIVNAYEVIGDSLVEGREIPFSDIVKKQTIALTNLINNRITAIRFETPSKDFLISGRFKGEKIEPIKYSFGTVKGVVETLSMHKRLSFTLWDSLFDKPVHCYFKEGDEENMRNVWGKKAIVSGRIGRQPQTGRVLIVRDVNYVRPIEDIKPGSYRLARGVLAWKEGDESAEDMIRRLRDGE